MSAEIVRRLATAVSAGEPVVVATVVETKRSVPRRPGSKMLVYPDGRTVGSVGGGEMEHRVAEAAAAALIDGRPRLLSYDLVNPGKGDPGVCGGEAKIYVEPYMPNPTVMIIGAGHVGRAVADLARWLELRTVVWDDRAELIEGLGDVDGVDVALTGSIEDALATEPVTPETAVVIVTRNVQLDLEILPQLLAVPSRYVGLMGSDRRWATTRKALTEMGVDREALDRVNTPIGVEIAAETPSEIAVSIMAEVIRHLRGQQAP